jgi:hypothetical protein
MSERQSTAFPDGSFPSSASSMVSTTSSYRHHLSSLMITTTPAAPKPCLMNDEGHEPRTRGSLGILIVGVGGANGTTLLAGALANRHDMEWRGPKGEPRSANYYGCITQLNQKGGGVGYKDKIKGLADFSMASVGGWVCCDCLDCCDSSCMSFSFSCGCQSLLGYSSGSLRRCVVGCSNSRL